LNSSIKVNDFIFQSKYIGLIPDTNLYQIFFFDYNIALPIGNVETNIEFEFSNCNDGAALLYDIFDLF
jgi:hypothetical protein